MFRHSSLEILGKCVSFGRCAWFSRGPITYYFLQNLIQVLGALSGTKQTTTQNFGILDYFFGRAFLYLSRMQYPST